MVGSYEIRQGTGTVTVEKQGLYYCFSCRCDLSGQSMCRLVLNTDAQQVDLGVCVPMDGCFGVEKRIPCKQVAEGNWEFLLMPKQARREGNFVPVYPEEPFAYMAKLKDAYLANKNGRIGIVITE